MKENIQMYFDPQIAEDFAEHEQNEKNFQVADVVDQVIMKIIKNFDNNFKAVELGWGAHPDRYHRLFAELIKHNWVIDWVDISPYMLELAKKYIDNDEYRNRLKVINFVKSEILSYLESLENKSIDLAIMKYTIDHIKDIDKLFELLSLKLKKEGKLIATIGWLSPELKSISTNARFLYNGEEFPENETRILKDGDTFTVKFFEVSGKPEFGYIKGGETTKYYHSEKKYRELAEKYWFEIFLGNSKDFLWDKWKEFVNINQEILILNPGSKF